MSNTEQLQENNTNLANIASTFSSLPTATQVAQQHETMLNDLSEIKTAVSNGVAQEDTNQEIKNLIGNTNDTDGNNTMGTVMGKLNSVYEKLSDTGNSEESVIASNTVQLTIDTNRGLYSESISANYNKSSSVKIYQLKLSPNFIFKKIGSIRIKVTFTVTGSITSTNYANIYLSLIKTSVGNSLRPIGTEITGSASSAKLSAAKSIDLGSENSSTRKTYNAGTYTETMDLDLTTNDIWSLWLQIDSSNTNSTSQVTIEGLTMDRIEICYDKDQYIEI